MNSLTSLPSATNSATSGEPMSFEPRGAGTAGFTLNHWIRDWPSSLPMYCACTPTVQPACKLPHSVTLRTTGSPESKCKYVGGKGKKRKFHLFFFLFKEKKKEDRLGTCLHSRNGNFNAKSSHSKTTPCSMRAEEAMTGWPATPSHRIGVSSTDMMHPRSNSDNVNCLEPCTSISSTARGASPIGVRYHLKGERDKGKKREGGRWGEVISPYNTNSS